MRSPTRLREVYIDAVRENFSLAGIVFLLRVVAGALVPLEAWALGSLLAAGVAGDRSGAVTAAVLAAACNVGSSALNHPSGRFELRLRQRVNLAHHLAMARSSFNAETSAFLDDAEIRDRLTAARAATGSLGGLLGQAVDAVQIAVTLTVSTVILARISPPLLLVIVVAVPATLLNAAAARVRHEAADVAARSHRQSDRLLTLSTDQRAAPELAVNGTRALLQQEARRSLRASGRVLAAAEIRATVFSAVGWVIFAAGTIGVVLVLATGAASGAVGVGAVATVMFLVIRLNEDVAEMTNAVSALHRSNLSARRVLALHASNVAGSTQPKPSGTVTVDRSTRAEDELAPVVLSLNDASFHYPNRRDAGVFDVNLEVHAGETLAIVGENGSGKSTLVKMLCGLVPLTSGERHVSASRDTVAAVFQDFARFEFTVYDTVGGAAGVPPDAIRRALELSRAIELVNQLPDGARTLLGRRWTGGTDLSLGQWQRLAVARAYAQPDPVLFVMDEPSSGLDTATEAELFAQFAEVTRSGFIQRYASVLVTHRLGSVGVADRILVLDRGHIVEQGTHAELLEAGGVYADLYELQKRGYR